MRTTFMILSMLCWGGLSVAQPSITSLSSLPDNHQEAFLEEAFFGTDPELLTGTGQTWNYTEEGEFFDLMYRPVTTTHTDVSASSFGSTFPEATSFEITGEGMQTFYKQDNTSKQVVGLYRAGIVIVHSDPMKMMTVPFSFGETQTDDYTGGGKLFEDSLQIIGSLTTTYDGYGTLILPSGTFEDMLRVKSVKDEKNLFYSHGEALSSGSYRLVTTTYNWYKAGEQEPFFTILYMDSYNNDEFTGRGNRAYFRKEQNVTGVFQPNTTASATVFPQPAAEKVTFSSDNLNGVCRIKLFTISGTQMVDEAMNASNHQVTLDISHLQQGIYLSEIENGTALYRQKIMVR